MNRSGLVAYRSAAPAASSTLPGGVGHAADVADVVRAQARIEGFLPGGSALRFVTPGGQDGLAEGVSAAFAGMPEPVRARSRRKPR